MDPVRRAQRALVVAMMVLAFCAAVPAPIGWVGAPIALVVPGAATLTVADPTRVVTTRMLPLVVTVSLATYPLLALVCFVVSQQFTAARLVVALVGLVAVAVGRLEGARHRQQPREAIPVDPPVGIVASMSLVIATAIAVGGLALLPGPEEAPFVQVSLTGAWAFVDRPVIVGDQTRFDVEVELRNESSEELLVEVVGVFDRPGHAVERGPEIGHQRDENAAEVILGSGERRVVTVRVQPPFGCGTLLVITPTIRRRPDLVPDPLFVSFDRPDPATNECAVDRLDPSR